MEELMAYAHSASAEGYVPAIPGQGTQECHIFSANKMSKYCNAADLNTSTLMNA